MFLKDARWVAPKISGHILLPAKRQQQHELLKVLEPWTQGNSLGRGRWTWTFIPSWAFLGLTGMAQVAQTLANVFFKWLSAPWEIISPRHNSLRPNGPTIITQLGRKQPLNKTNSFSQWVSGTENIFYTHGSTNFCSKEHKIFIGL